MNKEKDKSTLSQMGVSAKEKTEDKILDRDRSAPVSVYHESTDNPHPGGASGERDVAHDALDRDKPGPVSVSPVGKERPSYTYNADKTDPIDPHLADQSGYSKRKGSEKEKKY